MDDKDEVPEDYELLGEGRRGRFAAMARAGTNLVPVDTDILSRFPNKALVNGLLRELVAAMDQVNNVSQVIASMRQVHPDSLDPAELQLTSELLLIERGDGTFTVKRAENVPDIFIEQSPHGDFNMRLRNGIRADIEAATVSDAVSFALRIHPNAVIRVELFGNRISSEDLV